MSNKKISANDPRTVARDIPGIFDALFPQLSPGVVASFNRESNPVAGCAPLPANLIAGSSLERAMLFEIAVAAAEQLLKKEGHIVWDTCLDVAVSRQQRHFDAKIPVSLSPADKVAAEWVSRNLVAMLSKMNSGSDTESLVHSPAIPGYQWIASGTGDFSIGTKLIEVKCTGRHFSSSDYRQIIMYWLLGYASSVENDTPEWSEGILMNPRLNRIIRFPFRKIIGVIGAGRSKVELLELFSSMVGDHNFHKFDSNH
ncbi:hypothetical protein [Glaciimonas soli]|uniref:Uncharacterized protein n=1 Tax=Glaciimonas soli TaxID=2590999 RepID=A0A843YQ01_9BURK|nr:hypothetical protein [Glaciimonas soli]MQR01120.1 hypothetical protein [Glaciimonas soli]